MLKRVLLSGYLAWVGALTVPAVEAAAAPGVGITGCRVAAEPDTLSGQAVQADSLPSRRDTLGRSEFTIYYPVSRTYIREDYLDNRENLPVIRDYLARSPRIDSIIIYSYASPEGAYAFNVSLSRRRGEAAKQYILRHLPEGKEVPADAIRLSPIAENWEGLRQEVAARYMGADREELLRLLDDTSITSDEKKRRLRRLDWGRTWLHLLSDYMPRLRHATWSCFWLPPCDTLPGRLTMAGVPAWPTEAMPQQPVPVTVPLPEDTRTILALKTNLLYDALTLANVAVEVPVSEGRYSLLYNHQFPWWLWGDNKYCLRYLQVGGEFRWWFGLRPRPATARRVKRDALVGQFAGIYVEGGKWDFQNRLKYCYQGEFWSTGLSYGLSVPVGRRLNLEFAVSAGYASIPYRHYIPSEDWQLLLRDHGKSGTWHYFGPTKVEVSLVLPILVKVKPGSRKEKKGGMP